MGLSWEKIQAVAALGPGTAATVNMQEVLRELLPDVGYHAQQTTSPRKLGPYNARRVHYRPNACEYMRYETSIIHL